MSVSSAEKPVFLVTGFDPFGGQNVNPSFEAVRQLDAAAVGARLHIREIPTRFGTASAALRQAVAEVRPDFILCVGQAGGRAFVTPERLALNLRAASIPDNAGFQPREEKINPQGPDVRLNPLDVVSLTERLNAQRPVFRVSYHAGTFVCNELYYTLLGCGTPGLFVHVPYLPEQVTDGHTPSMPLDGITDALTLVLREAVRLTGGAG